MPIELQGERMRSLIKTFIVLAVSATVVFLFSLPVVARGAGTISNSPSAITLTNAQIKSADDIIRGLENCRFIKIQGAIPAHKKKAEGKRSSFSFF